MLPDYLWQQAVWSKQLGDDGAQQRPLLDMVWDLLHLGRGLSTQCVQCQWEVRADGSPCSQTPIGGSHSHTLHQRPHFVLSALIPGKHQAGLMLRNAHSATCWFVGQGGQCWLVHIFK